jgi:hypothetical protein
MINIKEDPHDNDKEKSFIHIHIYTYMYVYDRKGKNLDVYLGEEKKEKRRTIYVSIQRKSPYEHIYFRCGS